MNVPGHRVSRNCPCCGHKLPSSHVFFEAKTGILVNNGRSIHMTPCAALCFSLLLAAYPKSVSIATMTKRYSLGRTAVTDASAHRAVHAQLCYLRRKMDSIGLGITKGIYGTGNYTLTICPAGLKGK